MHKTLYSLLLAFFVFNLSFGQSQSSGFIEVTTTDTIQIDAETIYYTIFCNTEESTQSGYGNTEGMLVLTEYEKIKKIIAEMQLDLIENSLSITPENYGSKKLMIRFSSIPKLKDFIKKISDFKNIQSYVSNLTTNDRIIKEKTNLLYDKILQKARNEAKVIAEKSKKQLHDIIQIQMSEPQFNGGWTAYPPLSALRNNEPWGEELKIVLTRNITIRFSVK